MDDDLIERIYDAALDRSLWPDVLRAIADTCGAVSAGLWIPVQQQAGVVVSRGSEEAQAAYVESWWQHDLVGGVVLNAKRTGLFCDWETLPAAVRTRHAYYQDFQRRFDLKDNVAFTRQLDSGSLLGISLQFPFARPDPPDPIIVERFGRMGRHVGRAVLFAQRVAPDAALRDGWSDEWPDLVTGLMATLSCGVACLDLAGRVLLANPALERFAEDGLGIVNGRLKAAHPADQARLDAVIRGALGTVEQAPQALAAVSRPSGRGAFLVSALPVSAGRQATVLAGAPRCRAIVTVIDPDSTAAAKLEPALRSLDLSPAEARLATLVGSGLSPRDAAEKLGVAEETARSRLKRIFEKLGVSRQSELARLVTQIAMVSGR